MYILSALRGHKSKSLLAVTKVLNSGFYGFPNLWLLAKNCILVFGNKRIPLRSRRKCVSQIERAWILLTIDDLTRATRNTFSAVGTSFLHTIQTTSKWQLANPNKEVMVLHLIENRRFSLLILIDQRCYWQSYCFHPCVLMPYTRLQFHFPVYLRN